MHNKQSKHGCLCIKQSKSGVLVCDSRLFVNSTCIVGVKWSGGRQHNVTPPNDVFYVTLRENHKSRHFTFKRQQFLLIVRW